MSTRPPFWSELKRRNVLRVGLAWLALAWLLIAIADLLFPYLGFPDEVIKALIVGLLIALLPVLVLSWLFELTPRGLRFDRGPAAENPENRRTGRRLDQLTIVLIVLALGMSAIREFVLPEGAGPEPPTQVADGESAEAEPAPLPSAPPGPIDPRSIAVLPFANMSPDAENAFLADGMAEEILNVLARVEGLKVASRTSSFSFRNESVGVREIGRRLGIANVVDGSVRRQGDRVRITAQLVKAATDRQLWSGSFDRELTDIFALQQEIAQAIADALADTLGMRTVRVRRATDNLQAYELYLRGRQLFAQRGASLMPARELLRETVELDPAFAEAWAVLASVEYVLPSYFAEAHTAEANRRASEAAEKALALVAEEPNALAVSARLAADDGRRIEALSFAERALKQDPNNANTWMWKGLTLLETGHVAAARECFERARALDPLSGIHYGWLGATEVIEGNLESAEEHLKRAHQLGWRGPASAWRLKLALTRHDFGEQSANAFDNWLHDDERIGDQVRAVYQDAAPAVGENSRLPAVRERLREARRQMPEHDWTNLLLFLGLTDDAVAEALRPKPPSGQIVLMMIWSPVDKSFREHPDFMRLAEEKGLIEFWNHHGWPDHCRPAGGVPEQLECER
ncbi:MAG: tetratricopeptide repeat protein [Wenzhouxiangellaceae bacterium]|nr:tetratricopeptide repeat protein [Wenzhouxiangellaceae bacterium]